MSLIIKSLLLKDHVSCFTKWSHDLHVNECTLDNFCVAHCAPDGATLFANGRPEIRTTMLPFERQRSFPFPADVYILTILCKETNKLVIY